MSRQHKRPVTWDEHSGHISFAVGDCRLSADAGTLTLSLASPDHELLVQLQTVVVRHLIRLRLSKGAADRLVGD